MLNHKFSLRIYALLLFGVLIIMSGCGNKKADLIGSDLIDSEEGFGTDKVKNGELKEEKSFSASVVYPESAVICSQYNGVILEKIEVETGDKVKKGDLLVRIKQVTEETIAEQEQAIAKNLEELNAGINNYNSQISSLEQSIASSSGLEQQIFQVEKQKVQRQIEYYKEDGDKVQQTMKDELEILKTLQGDLNIYAPYDCVVDTIGNVPEGTELTTTRELVTIHSEAESFVRVSEGSDLKYNMPVVVESGLGENKTVYEGRVISADNVLDDNFQSGAAYIKLNENVPADELNNLNVRADVKKLNNVLLVKSFAVSTQNDKSYVSIVEGNKIMKRPVIVGADDGSYVWIVRGLEEGQQVLIQ